MQVSDVQVGELIKGTIKKLTESGLFVMISGNVDGVVWPNHYADITLKHPSRRFKPGASIKCRVSARRLSSRLWLTSGYRCLRLTPRENVLL